MKYFDSKAAEEKWSRYWLEQGVYRFDENSDKVVFSVDTPPPTVSGSLHIGHVFSYTHTDIICRFQRMIGRNVFYPIGWDDNGLPTERRVQNYYHIQCDPSVAYEEDLDFGEADRKTRKGRSRKISRKNFIGHCRKLTALDEEVFKHLWMRNGLSVEWEREYSTIDETSMIAAQRSFIDLHEKDHLYSSDAPVMWDIDFETAVAQAEIEDREEESYYHFINFPVDNGETIRIATTRPELLPACVGITAHPEDKRYQHLFGRKAITPLFHVPVPIFPSSEADPEKGTGILMVCTFGDAMDVEWWKRHKLPLRQIITSAGRICSVPFGEENWPSGNREEAEAHMKELEGKTIFSARKAIVELLAQNRSGIDYISGAPEKTLHPVRYYEKGKRPLEILSSRQWFVRLLDKKEKLLQAGEDLNWFPEHMGKRYRDWTENLKFDWCISRQRFFGVPIPVWYPLDNEGMPLYDSPILPATESLPVDPSADAPAQYKEEQRGCPGGFTAEKDIFDTWFTSSLTPQISSGWGKVPLTIRPQSHEIIRTWTFYTIAKSLLHEDSLPWKDVLISGWILDKDRKKMSKSKGNVVTPEDWFDRYGADSVRYWAAGARLGTDTAFDEQVLKTGRKLVTKIFNAAKFVLSFPLPPRGDMEDLDLSFSETLDICLKRATALFESYNFASALDEIESFFWHSFCDSYLELVKGRAKAGNFSAVYTLRDTLEKILKAFAPFLPFITEEIWSEGFQSDTTSRSIHSENWPEGNLTEDRDQQSDPEIFELAAKCLQAIHSRKSEAGVSLKTMITLAEFGLSAQQTALFPKIEADLKRTGWIEQIQIHELSEEEDFYLNVTF